MERLNIEELIEHCDRQMNRLPSGNKFYQEHESVRAYLQLLRHYIATDLTPEQIKDADDFLKENYGMPLERLKEGMELIKAKDAGRLVVLPCKVGDFVYDISDGTCYATQVLSFTIYNGWMACRTVSSYPDVSEFGSRVFLTRQEAEEALREEKEK